MLRSLTIGCLLAAAALPLVAPPAPAATLSRTADTSEIVYVAGDGEANRLTIARDSQNHIFTDDPSVTITPVPPCSRPGPELNVAVCPYGYAMDVALGDLDDTASLGSTDFGYPIFRGGEGEDTFTGSSSTASSSMIGGPGRDTYVNGSGGFDSANYSDKPGPVTASLDGVANDPDGENVPPGIDALVGTESGDILSGSPELDYLFGFGGDDRLLGLDGNDDLQGGEGDDRHEGGAGNDVFLYKDAGADDFSGGEGFDRYQIDGNPFSSDRQDYAVTLDDVADDGYPGEGDNVHSDVEDVNTRFTLFSPLRVRIVGSGAFNVLTGGSQADQLTGGPGDDVLSSFGGDDTINARDGSQDRVDCGPGADRAVVDAVDKLEGCEQVELPPTATAPAPPPAAADDRPPSVSFTSPRQDSTIGRPSNVAVDAGDDRGVARVLLLDDGRVVGSDSTAPYAFSYAPGADDVGRNTLVAVAVDGAEQTATAVRAVRVDRFRPSLRASAQPARDRRAPYRFRVTGTVAPPSGVSAAQACRAGVVSIQVKSGRRTISTRRANVSRTCRFDRTLVFTDRRRLGRGRLRATVRFIGNEVLAPATARSFGLVAG